jgi:hypothetical protein
MSAINIVLWNSLGEAIFSAEETEFKYERTRQPQPKLGPLRDQLDGILLPTKPRPPENG